MKKLNITPAPWTDTGIKYGDIYGTWPDDGYLHHPIIECDSGAYGPYDDDRALILAAPDLYKALKLLRAMVDVKKSDWPTLYPRALSMSDKALAKAEKNL